MISVSINQRSITLILLTFHLIFIVSHFLSGLTDVIYIVKSIVGFLYLSFFPGLIITKLMNLSDVRKLYHLIIYSLIISLWFNILVLFILNFVFISLKIKLFLTPFLIIIYSAITTIILIFLFCENNQNNLRFHIQLRFKYSKDILVSSLFPIFAIIGSLDLIYRNSNLIIIFTLIVVLVYITSILLKQRSDISNYIISAYFISLALLLQSTLSVPYIRYGDSEIEYYLSKLVINNGYWDPSIPRNKNAMLVITLLHPFYSKICGIPLDLTYKLIYIMIFSFIVVILFFVYKSLLKDDKLSFTSLIFFSSSYMFITWLSKSTRQGFAELFLAFILFILLNNDLPEEYKKFLLIISISSLIVSHYGTAFVFLFLIISDIVFLKLLKSLSIIKNDIENIINVMTKIAVLTSVIMFAWYIYIAESKPFETFLDTFIRLKNVLSFEFFSPAYSFTLHVLEKNWPFTIQFLKYVYIIIILLALVGSADTLRNLLVLSRKGEKFGENTLILTSLSVVSLILIISTFLPLISKRITTDRILAILFIIIAPYILAGVDRIMSLLKTTLKFKPNTKHVMQKITIVALIIMFFSFNTGISSEIIDGSDYSPSIILSKGRILDGKIDPDGIILFYKQYISTFDVVSSIWIKDYGVINYKLYSSNWIGTPGLPYGYPICPWGVLVKEWEKVSCPEYQVLLEAKSVDSESYIYIGFPNKYHKIIVSKMHHPAKWYNIEKLYPLLNQSSKIYTNGGSEIYLKE